MDSPLAQSNMKNGWSVLKLAENWGLRDAILQTWINLNFYDVHFKVTNKYDVLKKHDNYREHSILKHKIFNTGAVITYYQ